MVGLGVKLGLSQRNKGLPSVPFDPAQSATIIDWLDSTQGKTEPSSVLSWAGTEGVLTASGVSTANSPATGSDTVNSIPVLTFANDRIDIAGIPVTDGKLQFSFMFRIDAVTSVGDSLWSITDGGGGNLVEFRSLNGSVFEGQIRNVSGTTISASASPVAGRNFEDANHVCTVIFDPDNAWVRTYIDGELEVSATYNTNLPTGITVRLMAQAAGNQKIDEGLIGDVIFDSDPSLTTARQHHNYLATRFAITAGSISTIRYSSEEALSTGDVTYPQSNSLTAPSWATHAILTVSHENPGGVRQAVDIAGVEVDAIGEVTTGLSTGGALTRAHFAGAVTGGASTAFGIDLINANGASEGLDHEVEACVTWTNFTPGSFQLYTEAPSYPADVAVQQTVTVPGVNVTGEALVLMSISDDSAASLPELETFGARNTVSTKLGLAAKVMTRTRTDEDMVFQTQSGGNNDAQIGTVLVCYAAQQNTVGVDFYEPFQVRKATAGSFSFPISGTYTGAAPSGIQVEAIKKADKSTVTAYATVDASPSGGTWSGNVVVPAGEDAIFFKVRRAGETAEVIHSQQMAVGIGAVTGGQSNGRRETELSPGAAVDTAADGHGWLKRIVHDSGSGDATIGYVWCPAGNFAGIKAVAKGIEDRCGCALGYGNVAVPASSLSTHLKGHSSGRYDEMLAMLQAFPELPSALHWNQGEAEASNGNSSSWATDLADYQDDLVTDLNITESQLPLIIGTRGPNTDGAEVDANHNAMNAQIIQAAEDNTNIHLGYEAADVTLTDTVHWDAASQSAIQARVAYEIARLKGDETGSAIFDITGATKASATTTTITVSHGIGTDFTPTSAITAFEVSDDSFATTETITAAVRTDATTITLTHADIGTGTRHIRHLAGANPTVTGLVTSNGALSMPLLKQPTDLEATAAGASGLSSGFSSGFS